MVSSYMEFSLASFQIETLALLVTASLGVGNGLDNLIYGTSLNNTLVSGTGNDTLYGFGGLNTLAGGDNNDTYYVDMATDLIIEYANEGLDTVIARHDYVLPETSVENITAWEYGGFMIITGNSLNNVIIGNNGFNVIDGRGGADTLYGGAFADQFVFSDVSHSAAGARDEIMDFSSADHDYIDLSLIDANTALMGDQAFTFHGSAAFSGVAGQLRVAGVFVEGDVNGDAVADFVLAVFGSTPVETDFVL